jgi:60 kDa SS-A/Ro ribonucleoprotein
MANNTLFSSILGKTPTANAVNEAGGHAYALSEKHALAQLAATGCFTATYYASAEDQLSKVLELAAKVPTDFLARTAVYTREHGFMKDTPAALAAVLASRDPERLETIFPRVIDTAKMLRNFVQILRCGVTGRRSLGSLPKRLVRQWLERQSDAALFRADVGNDPSLADIIKMVHPKPSTASREALYGYLLGRAHNAQLLPEVVRQFEAFKADPAGNPPDVPFQMLTSLNLQTHHWTAIARRASWQTTRMNLNTFARHGVFTETDITLQLAKRLRDPELVRKARCFPYQLMTAFTNLSSDVPHEIREALQDAMEVAVANVPQAQGKVYVFPDVSGSMGSPATGHRKGATSSVRCIDVAALVAAAILRQNSSAEVLPFERDIVKNLRLNPRDSIMTNATKLASIGGGGTNCSAPLRHLNQTGAKADLIIYVSDNESWMDPAKSRGTATMEQWQIFKKRNPQARMVCVDIQPYTTVQAQDQADILNVGGFSDSVFDIISAFANGTLGASHWVGQIEQVQL